MPITRPNWRALSQRILAMDMRLTITLVAIEIWIFYFPIITLVYRKKILKYTIEVYDRFLCFLGWGIRFCHRFSSISSRFCCIESGYFFISIEIKNFIFWKKWIFIKSMIVSYVFWGEKFDYPIHFYSACLDFA